MLRRKFLIHVNNDHRESRTFLRAMEQLNHPLTVRLAQSAQEAREYISRVLNGEPIPRPDGIICDLGKALSPVFELWEWLQQRRVAQDMLFMVLTDEESFLDAQPDDGTGPLFVPRVPQRRSNA
jgi:hypothetical protein